MGKSKNILISGYYGFDNSGDDAILKAIVKELKSREENLNINVLSKNPLKTEEMYGVNALDRFNFGEVRKAIKETDLLISGGGSLLQDITSTRSILYYLAIMKLAKLNKRPVMIYANGVGPINKLLNRILTRSILNRVDLITLRDDVSMDFVKSLGVGNKNIHVTADPVYTLDASPELRIEEIFSIEEVDTSKKIVGISIREWKAGKDIVGNMVRTINHILEEYDYNVLLIPMHYPDDLDIAFEIQEDLDKSRVFVVKENYSVEDVMGIISKMDIMVAMRLHSLIYAATQKVPMVGISYDPKIDGILESLSIENIVDVHKLDHRDLIENIDYVIENREDLLSNLDKQDKNLKSKARENVDLALELLRKGD